MTRQLAVSTIDCLVWQTLASVMVPGYVIHQVVKATSWAIKGRFAGPQAQFIPVIVGLSAIPFIVKPIDHSVDMLMDHTYRKFV